MSYSDIVGTISGLLQFAVACYALRVSRIYGMVRVGWMFFGAFTLLAVVHLLLSVHPFGTVLELGVSVNVFYEVISVLLLGTIFQMEFLLWKRRQQQKLDAEARARAESKSKEQLAQLIAANEALKHAAAGFQAEATQREQTLRQALDQSEKTFQELLGASRQAEEALHEMVAQLQAELAQQKQTFEQTLEESEKAFQQQLVAARQAEDEWRSTAESVQAEVARQMQAAGQSESAFQEQLAILRQSEAALRESLARAAAVQPIQPAAQPETSLHEELAALRQSEAALRESLARAAAVQPAQPAAQPETSLREELAALRQSEAALRERLARAEAEARQPKRSVEPIKATAPAPAGSASGEPATEAQPDPLDILRQSGIAEVAVMTQSRAAYIARLARLLRAHEKHMGRFMTRSLQGRRLPKSLSLLVEYLADEQFLLLRRIDSVKKKFEHLKKTRAVSTDRDRTSNAPRLNAADGQPQESPHGPIDEGLGAGDRAGDYREHLISNLTETGTESTNDDLPNTGQARPDHGALVQDSKKG